MYSFPIIMAATLLVSHTQASDEVILPQKETSKKKKGDKMKRKGAESNRKKRIQQMIIFQLLHAANIMIQIGMR